MVFSDEELALIMDAHETGKLKVRGKFSDGKCCLLMAAIGAGDDPLDERTGWCWAEWRDRLGLEASNYAVWWFDENYQPSWSTDEFLRQLEAQGWA